MNAPLPQSNIFEVIELLQLFLVRKSQSKIKKGGRVQDKLMLLRFFLHVMLSGISFHIVSGRYYQKAPAEKILAQKNRLVWRNAQKVC